MEQFNELLEGILDACTYYETPLIGGDTNESPQIVLNGTALGEISKEKVLMKKNLQKGNLIVVTGTLGMAAAGFEILLADDNDSLLKLNHLKEEFVKSCRTCFESPGQN